MKYQYMAVISPRPDGTGYDCSVPDIPHCISSGSDLSEALAMIRDAAALVLVGYEDLGKQPPKATGLAGIQMREGCSTVSIELDTVVYRRETLHL